MEPDKQVNIFDVVNAGINPEWDGTVEIAPNPILEWLGVDLADPLVRDRSVIAIQDTLNRQITMILEVPPSPPDGWFRQLYLNARQRRRMNSYQRRRARKPWLYEGRKGR